MSDWIETADAFAGHVHARLQQRYNDVHITEPSGGIYVWVERGQGVTQMLVRPNEGRVSVHFIASEGVETKPEQFFPYRMESVNAIAQAMIDWIDDARKERVKRMFKKQ